MRAGSFGFCCCCFFVKEIVFRHYRLLGGKPCIKQNKPKLDCQFAWLYKVGSSVNFEGVVIEECGVQIPKQLQNSVGVVM